MRKIIVPLLALAVGGALGYVLKPSDAPAVSEAPQKAKRAKGAIADAGDRETVRMLQKRIAALERELAAARSASAAEDAAPAQDAAAVAENRPERRGPGDFRERLKQLEKEDPQKYAQITNRFARMRQRRLDRTRGKIEFLASIDVSSLGSRATKVHGGLQKAIADREALEEQMHDENLTDEERQQLMRQMREADRTTRQLAGEERSNLLKLTAQGLGLSGEDAQALVDTVSDVVESTETHGGPHGPPPEGGPGGPHP